MTRDKLSETDFSTQIETLFEIYDWKWMHIKPSIMQSGRWASSMNAGGKGWLDYCAVRRGRVLIVELKNDKAKLTPEQEVWFNLWKECDVELYLWRPKMIDEIMEVLK